MTEEREHLILKYLQGKISPEEGAAFESWMNESPENRQLVEDLGRVLKITSGAPIAKDFQSEQEWQKLESVLHADREAAVHKLEPAGKLWIRIAAALLFLLLSSFIVYLFFFKTDRVEMQTTENTLHFQLPDGSEVWLNTQSHLTYQSDFAQNRFLKLEGEAFFDVKKNPDKPFVIQTDEARVRVVGTSFNVKARNNEIQTEVFVVTGKVSLGANDNEKTIMLEQGATGVLANRDHQLTSLAQGDPNIVAWKSKQLVFQKTPLRSVVKILRAYFKKDIRIRNEALLSCRFTSSFNDPTLKEVIETLDFALDLDVLREQDAYILDGAGCKEN